MEALDAAVDDVAGTPVASMGDRALGDWLINLRRGIDRLEAEFAHALGEFDRRKAYRADGAASAVAWLKDRCRLSGGAAAKRVEVARELEAVPGATTAFRAGEMGFSNAAVLSRTSAEIGPKAASIAGEQLLDAAQQLQPEQCRALGRQLRHSVDPEGELAQALRDHERRRFSLSQAMDGMFLCEGLLDAEGGAALRTALLALDPPLPGDTRSGQQRRADALVELATRQLRSQTLPRCKGQRPHLVLNASPASLQGRRAERAAELRHAGPVTTEQARRIACDAVVSVVGDRREQAQAVATRTVPPALRRALEARDAGCRFPGCDRGLEWCEAHHIVHVADGGETTLDNLMLACRLHHRCLHEGGWTVTVHDGLVVVRPPPRRA